MRIIFLSVVFLFITFKLMSQRDGVIVDSIIISGNRITRERIILRELQFAKGDTLSLSDIDKAITSSRENLLNTSLFNYITISSDRITQQKIHIIINVEERWYTWPALILKYDDRNFSAWLKSKDLSRSEYGFSVERLNFFGRKENLRISILLGYTNQFTLSYRNIALDRKRRHFIGADLEFSRQDEIIFNTFENKPILFNNNYRTVYEKNKYTLNYTFRPYIYDLHKLYFNYIEHSVSDTIVSINPDFLMKNRSHLNCITLDYVFSKDKRDIKAYPLHGNYFELLIGQTISINKNSEPFFSTVFAPGFYQFIEINKRIYYATAINLKVSFSNADSYLYTRSLGYNYNMHGFEYNTIEGQHFIMYKNLLKFSILKERVTELSFIPIPKFNKIHYAVYFNIYGDCGYVSKKENTPDNNYANSFLYSAGAGIDLVTYYDRTFRAEYSINGFGVGGFYFHLTAPINN